MRIADICWQAWGELLVAIQIAKLSCIDSLRWAETGMIQIPGVAPFFADNRWVTQSCHGPLNCTYERD